MYHKQKNEIHLHPHIVPLCIRSCLISNGQINELNIRALEQKRSLLLCN